MADKLTPGQQQALDEARDARYRERENKAPTTKTEMGNTLFGSNSTLKDDETRMTRFGNLNTKEKAQIREKQKTDLSSATSDRQRPLGSRVLDKLYEAAPFVSPTNRRKEAEADTAQRESRYQTAKRRAETTDENLSKEPNLYGTNRTFKLEEGKKQGGSIKKYARGGATAKYMSFTKTGKPDGMKPVTKMARGGGCESRGKTKGRFV
tara:strand:- start:200 stop:823 length:624 start_codon:yes stop_codon:yes gene_type:complete